MPKTANTKFNSKKFKICNKETHFVKSLYKGAVEIENIQETTVKLSRKMDEWLAKHDCQLYTKKKEDRRPKKTT